MRNIDFQVAKEEKENYLIGNLQDKGFPIAQHILETAYHIYGESHERN